MNSGDPKGLASQKIVWPYFDGSAATPTTISERQYLEETYTFGASGKCRLTYEFSGVVIPGSGRAGDISVPVDGCDWIQIWNVEGAPKYLQILIGSGFLRFDAGSGQPTTACSIAYNNMINMPLSEKSWEDFGDIANEVFTLTVDLDRATYTPEFKITINFKSPNITLINNSSYTTGQGGDALPTSFVVRAGSRLLSKTNPWDMQAGGAVGAFGITVHKFSCVDVA